MQKVIDAHVHILNDSLFHLKWLEGEPSLEKNSSLEDYHNAWKGQDRYEVEKIIHIETDASLEDKERENAHFISVAKDPETAVDGVAVYIDMINDNAAKVIEEKFKDEPVVKSVRYILHMPYEAPDLCLDPRFVENVKKLGKYGIKFEACLRPEDLGNCVKLAKLCPETDFILNHMGIVDATAWADDSRKDYVDAWEKNISDLAALPNLTCKVSGLSSADVNLIAPIIDYCFDAFGEDRVMYASNFPVCKANISLNDWTFAMLDISAKRGKEFQNKFFYDNTVKIYNL